MPTIPELAVELGTLTRRVPADVVPDLHNDLDALRSEVKRVLGDAAGSDEIHQHIDGATGRVTELADALVQLRRVIADVSVYHQQRK